MLRMKKRAIRRFGLALPGWLQRPQVWLAHRAHNLTRTQRIICASVAGILFLSVAIPTTLVIMKNQSYKLSAEVQSLVGTPNKNLSAKITYNSEKDSWQFNQSNIPIGSSGQEASMPTVEDLKAQIGGSGKKDESLYAVDMPTSGTKGVTYYDTNTNLSFSLVPQFSLGEGRKSDEGHIVYPSVSGTKLIYTAKANGMKEDIVLDRPIGDAPTFAYKLNLPNTLEAKIQSDGSLGVFSPDPILFGDISFGGDSDKEKILSARQTATKDHLLFVLPAPVVVEADGHKSTSHARFILAGDTLTVQTNGMQDLKYPLSVDPSVVVTSSGDFGLASGDLIDYSTDQISRGNMTGGTLGTWDTTNSYSAAGTTGAGVAAMNGYLYAAGGDSGGTVDSDVEYVSINGDGMVGTWTTTSSLGTARTNHGFTAADTGYAYAVGGCVSGGSATTSVEYAKINTDGTLGSWSTTSSLSSATCGGVAVAYGGYLYYLGGSNSTTVQYAVLRADGTLGSWSTTTSFTNSRQNGGALAYNNRMYILGGYNGTSTYYADVQFANINSDGTLGTWTSTTSFTTARAGQFYGVYGGYAYIGGGSANIGGSNDAVGDTQYAQINADGTLGAWRSSTNMNTERFSGGTALYKGRMYGVGGTESGTGYRSVQYATIDPAGVTGDYTTTTSLSSSRYMHDSVVYNGRLYILGGYVSGVRSNSVEYATVNSDGTIGSWSSTTSFTTARRYLAAVAWNGYMYVLGGDVGSRANDVQYAPINSDGTIGSWTATTSFANGRLGLGAAIYGNYMYIYGGSDGSSYNDVQYAQINSDGTIGSWTATTSFTTGRRYFGSVIANGYLYILGGTTGSRRDDVQYAPINADGTLGSWNTTTSLTANRSDMTAEYVNGVILLIGGNTGSPIATVDYTHVNNGGSGKLSTWSQKTSGIGSTLSEYGSVYHDGYFYIIGGDTTGDGSTRTAVVRYAPLNSDGTIGSWTSTSSLNTARHSHAVYVSKDYMYVAGGSASGGASSSVEYASINNDGTLGSWTATTGSLPSTSQQLGFASYNGYLYALGGTNGSLLTTVAYAQPASNGNISSWSTTTSLPFGVSDNSSIAYNGYLYSIGGTDSSGDTAKIAYASINSNGTLGSWNYTTWFPDAGAVSAKAANGFLYILGVDGSSCTGATYRAPIQSNGSLGIFRQNASASACGDANGSGSYVNGNLYLPLSNGAVAAASMDSIARVARYTKTIDLSSAHSLNSISYNGSLYNSSKDFLYQDAPGTGVFGSVKSPSDISGGGGGACGGGSSSSRYIRLIATLDDTYASTYPDVNSSESNITDITIDYSSSATRAAPNQRLLHGKFFSGEVLQGLDTCAD